MTERIHPSKPGPGGRGGGLLALLLAAPAVIDAPPAAVHRDEVPRAAEPLRGSQDLQALETALRALKDRQRQPVQVLETLVNCLPEDVWLSELRWQGPRLRLTGEARTFEAANRFYDQVKEHPRRFSRVDYPGATRGGQGRVVFTMSMDVASGEPGPGEAQLAFDAQAAGTSPGLEARGAQVTAQKRRVDALLSSLATPGDRGEVPYRIKKLADEAGIDQTSFTTETPFVQGPLTGFPIRFSFRAGYHGFGMFLSRLSAYPTLLVMDDLEMTRRPDGRGVYTVDVRCRVSLFALTSMDGR